MTGAIIAIRAVAFATTDFSSSITVAVLFGTIRFSAIAKVILKIDIWNLCFFRKRERIFFNDFIDSLGSIHIIVIIFTTIAKTSLTS